MYPRTINIITRKTCKNESDPNYTNLPKVCKTDIHISKYVSFKVASFYI